MYAFETNTVITTSVNMRETLLARCLNRAVWLTQPLPSSHGIFLCSIELDLVYHLYFLEAIPDLLKPDAYSPQCLLQFHII
jgi:hypothetical protein